MHFDLSANTIIGTSTATGFNQVTLRGIENVTGTRYDDTIILNGLGNTLNGGGGSDTVDYSASGEGVSVDLAQGTGAGGHARLEGGPGDDSLNGGNGNGNDTLNGGAGNDEFYFYGNALEVRDAIIEDYTLRATKDDSEKLYMCMGTMSSFPTIRKTGADASNGQDYLITVTFYSETADTYGLHTITLKGITSSSANFANLNIQLSPVDYSGNCSTSAVLPEPQAGPLQVWFIEDTPIIVGSLVFMKVHTNKDSSALCYIDDGLAENGNLIHCPPGTLVSLPHPTGPFPVWPTAASSGETASSSTHEVVVGGPRPPWVWASGGNGKLLVGWDASSDAIRGNISAYIVQIRQQKTDGTYPAWTDTGAVTTTGKAASDREHIFNGLDNGTWEVRVRAQNDNDDTYVLGINSEVRTVTLAAANTNTPVAPLAAVTPGAGSLLVQWLRPDPDTGSLVHGYTVRYKVSGADDSTYKEKTVHPRRVGLEGGRNPNRLEISGLTAGVQYVVEIKSLNANGASAWFTIGITRRPN